MITTLLCSYKRCSPTTKGLVVSSQFHSIMSRSVTQAIKIVATANIFSLTVLSWNTFYVSERKSSLPGYNNCVRLILKSVSISRAHPLCRKGCGPHHCWVAWRRQCRIQMHPGKHRWNSPHPMSPFWNMWKAGCGSLPAFIFGPTSLINNSTTIRQIYLCF